MATIVTRQVKKVGILLYDSSKSTRKTLASLTSTHTWGSNECLTSNFTRLSLLFQITGTPDNPSITDSNTSILHVYTGTQEMADAGPQHERTSGYTCFRNCRHTNHMLNRTVTIFILGLLYAVLDTRGLWRLLQHSSCYSSASRSLQATDGKSGRRVSTQFTNYFNAFLHKLLVLLLYSKEPVRQQNSDTTPLSSLVLR